MPYFAKVNLSIFLPVMAVAALTSASAYLLPDKIFTKINYGYVGAVITLGAVWGTGIEKSPLFLLFLFSTTASAAILPVRRAYAVTAVNAVFSVMPLLHGFSTSLFRQEILFVPVMFGLTYIFGRVNEEARYQRRARYIMEAISRVGDLSSNFDLTSVLIALVDALRRVTESEYVLLYLLDDDGKTLRPVAVDGEPGQAIEEARMLADWPINVGEGFTGSVAKDGQSVIIGDVENDQRGVLIPDSPRSQISAIFVPLKAQGKVIGVMRLARSGLNRYTTADLELAEVVSQQASVAVQNSRLYEETRDLYEKTRWLSVTDPLTGLFNQRYLAERLPMEMARAQQYGGCLSLLMIDADTLKEINDRYGHDLGDQLIRSIADTLRSQIRIGDTAVRYAGDEFVVLLPDANEDQAMAVGERIRKAVEETDLGVEVPIAVSVGASTFPDHADTTEELVKHADAALYFSKRAGKNRLTVYRQAM